SSASESVCVLPSSTLPISSMTPAVNSSRSVRLVLPASTCARIPKLSVRTKRHVLRIGGNCPRERHERCTHGTLPADRLLVGCLGQSSRPRPRPATDFRPRPRRERVTAVLG